MARRIVHQLVDDLDGSLLEVGEGETVLFSLDGVAYEIDLTDENAAALRDAIAPFVAAGAASSSARGAQRIVGRATRKRRRTGQQDYTAVREWAARTATRCRSGGACRPPSSRRTRRRRAPDPARG